MYVCASHFSDNFNEQFWNNFAEMQRQQMIQQQNWQNMANFPNIPVNNGFLNQMPVNPGKWQSFSEMSNGFPDNNAIVDSSNSNFKWSSASSSCVTDSNGQTKCTQSQDSN